MKINSKRKILALVISLLYIGIGTYDNLSGLRIEKAVQIFMCGTEGSLCELMVLIFYSQSYLYGALFSGFLGSSNLAFIICQIIVLIPMYLILNLVLLIPIKLFKPNKT